MIFKNPKIGIIGLGFVGQAVFHAYQDFGSHIVGIDTDPNKNAHGTYSEIKECEAIFVCVPSPQLPDGSANTKILENVLENLKDYKGVIISKVTAPPDCYKNLQKKYNNLVYIPEFLTAANSVADYISAKFVIIGGEVLAYQHEAERIVKITHNDLSVHFCSIEEASLIKYTINSFLATKVTFMNEIYNLATSAGMDYNTIARLACLDQRMGNSHMLVPGPDSMFGFGGMCFPKDTSALIKYAESQNVSLNVLDSAVKKNTLLRLQKPK